MQTKNKILFVIDTVSCGGAELSVLEVAKNLQQFHPIVAVVYEAQNGLKESFEQAGIPLVFFGISKRFGFGEGIKQLKALIQQEKPVIVHATNFKSEIISRFAVPPFGIPLVGSIISDTYSKERYALVSYRERVKLNMYKLLNRITAKRVNKFVAVSKAIISPNMNYLKQPRNKFVVVPNGRNTAIFTRQLEANRSILFPEIPDNSKIIISTSRVIRSKGFDEMLIAFKSLLDKFPFLFFVVAGDGFDFDFYQLKSKSIGMEGKIIFLGRRNDIPNLLLNSDIFWFPSHYEGSPGVVIEAMLAKIPIIASDIPPVLENLKDEENALICKKGDVESLIEKTEILINNPYLGKKLADKAFELGVKKFDIIKLTANQESVYLDLITQYHKKSPQKI